NSILHSSWTWGALVVVLLFKLIATAATAGSGAIGGVVQVFTKDGGDHPPRFNFSVGYGSYHTQTQQAGVNGALDKDG
ncbi:hypothetical protein SB780_42185, partial [Burkholderia sp. SIMBA_057]